MSETAVEAASEVTPPPPPRRIRPAINEDNAYFWDGVAAGELRIQRCADCRELRHPSTPCCPICNSFSWDFIIASGHGSIYSFVVFHHPLVPPFEDPYVVAVIELEEGQRLVSEVIDIDTEEVQIGLAVDVTFMDVDPELTLPLFRPAAQ